MLINSRKLFRESIMFCRNLHCPGLIEYFRNWVHWICIALNGWMVIRSWDFGRGQTHTHTDFYHSKMVPRVWVALSWMSSSDQTHETDSNLIRFIEHNAFSVISLRPISRHPKWKAIMAYDLEVANVQSVNYPAKLSSTINITAATFLLIFYDNLIFWIQTKLIKC